MYKVILTIEKYYDRILSFNVWESDRDYFIFYWADDTSVIIHKKYIIIIEKYV